MGNGDNSIKGNILEVVPEWADEVRCSMDWIRQWYTGRMNYRLDGGLGLVERDDVYVTNYKISQTWVCANQGGADCIKKALQLGELSLWASDDALASYGLSKDGHVVNEALFNDRFTLKDGTFGCYYRLFDAPVVIINTELIRQGQAEGLPFYLQDTLIHELTHGLERTEDEKVAGALVRMEDSYLDTGAEVYARLNEIRAYLKLDPAKAVTLDEIARMRQFVSMKRQSYQLKLLELDKDKSYKQGKLDPSIFNKLPQFPLIDRMLSRYTDEELMMLFNETAMRRDLDDLDQEHTLALDQNAEKCLDTKLGLNIARKESIAQINRPIQNGSIRRG